MKACVLEEVGKLEYQEVSIPDIKDGEVLVKIKACGICSSDIPRVFKTGTYHFPTIPGHEFSGIVVDVAKDVSKELLGRKVVVYPLLPCHKCENCQEGQFARCNNYNYFGSRCDGGFSEYLSVPVWNIIICDSDMDYEVAALCEPTSVAIHGVRRSEVKKGDHVLIIGTGTIGILSALICQSLGAVVTVLGRGDRKLEFIKKLGDIVTKKESDLSLESDYDVVFECVGSNKAVKQAVAAAKKGGKIAIIGNPEGDMVFEKNLYWKILRNELQILGMWNSVYGSPDSDWIGALRFLKNNSEIVSKIITHTFELKDSKEAFQVLMNPEEFTIKVMFLM